MTVKSFVGGFSGSDVPNTVAWFLLAFAIFNTYMLIWSMRVNKAVFGVFLTLEITEILLVIGNFNCRRTATRSIRLGARGRLARDRHRRRRVVHLRGRSSRMESAGRTVVPVGKPIWTS